MQESENIQETEQDLSLLFGEPPSLHNSLNFKNLEPTTKKKKCSLMLLQGGFLQL